MMVLKPPTRRLIANSFQSASVVSIAPPAKAISTSGGMTSTGYATAMA